MKRTSWIERTWVVMQCLKRASGPMGSPSDSGSEGPGGRIGGECNTSVRDVSALGNTPTSHRHRDRLSAARRPLIHHPSELGAVSVEMVFFLLIFSLTFFGAVEMARQISVKHALDVGTYRAARYLSLVPSDLATARRFVQAELDSNVLGGAGSVQLSVNMPSQAFQAIFSVTAQVTYQPTVPFIIFAPKVLSVTHSQSIEKYP